MHRLQLGQTHRLRERRDARPVQPRGEPCPLAGYAVVDLVELPEDMAAIRVEREVQPPVADRRTRSDVLEPGPTVTERDEHRRVVGEPEAVGERPPDRPLRTVRGLDRVPGRTVDPPRRRGEPGVIQHERPLWSGPIRIGEDSVIDAVCGHEVVEQEVGRPREPAPPMEQREDLPLVSLDQPWVGFLGDHRPPELHPVLLAEPLHLAMTEHRQPGERREHRRDAEVLVTLAELLDGGLLVGIAHEVDVALEDLRIELDRLADDLPVALAVLVAEHVHERAVVDAMHTERPDEIALEQPERLGEEQGVWDLRGDPVDDLTPELDGHPAVELSFGHRMLSPGWDAATLAGLRPPQPLDVLLGEHHGGVEPDDREAPRDLDDRPDDLLADGWVEEVELCRVVPREARAVVAVVDVAVVAARAVRSLEDDGGVAVVPVVVLEDDRHASVR